MFNTFENLYEKYAILKAITEFDIHVKHLYAPHLNDVRFKLLLK